MSEEFTAEQPAEQPVNNSTEGINEAWTPLLNNLPDAYHQQVIPTLKDWDRNVQQRFDSYSPYKEFIDQKVDPNNLRVGMGLMQQIQQDPEQFYRDLGAHLGISAEEAEELVEETEETGVDPAIAQLQQQQEQMQQYVMQQQQREIQQQQDAQVHSEVEALVNKYNIPPGPVLASIIQRALSTTQGDLEAAYAQEVAYQNYLSQRNPNNSAPSVISGAGSAGGTPPKSVNELTGKDRRAALANALRQGLNS